MRADTGLTRLLDRAGAGRWLAPRLAGLRRIAPRAADRLAFALAGAAFLRGDYATAHGLYADVAGGPALAEAQRMADWTAHKLGRIALGWPRYPVAAFAPPPPPPAPRLSRPIRVADPARPLELVTELALPPWSPETGDARPPLVWFNFRNSLGGELFTARAVRALLSDTGTPAALAADPRLATVLARNFPGCEVLDRDDDLAPHAGRFSGYLLARDALARVVQRPKDADKIARVTFALPGPPAPARPRARPLVAISWKTTNKRQGRYRNIPAADFARALAGIDADFVSAQHGVSPAERAAFEAALGPRIDFEAIDPGADLAGFAAALSQADAVLSIDNSVIHVAGSFGLPALALLSVPSYWAWPASGERCHWYGTLRLLHQEAPGDWGPVLRAIPRALAELTGGAP